MYVGRNLPIDVVVDGLSYCLAFLEGLELLIHEVEVLLSGLKSGTT